jgi:uncharacterized protein (DUF697 family)
MNQSDRDNSIMNKDKLREHLKAAKKEAKELGGWNSFKSGEWLFRLIKKSFKNYWERGNAEYFYDKYKTKETEFIVKKLIEVAARNAAIIGSLTGAAVSANEIAAIIQALATPASSGASNIPLPAEIAIVVAALTGEAVLLIRFQLQLVVNIAKLYKMPLDPDDPEDILTILAFAVGGAVAEEAGRLGMKVGGKAAGLAAKSVFKKEFLVALKRIGNKLGIKILQRTIVKYVIPLASMAIGTTWNYMSTKSVGKIAQKHFILRATTNA